MASSSSFTRVPVDPARIRSHLKDFAAIGYRAREGMNRLAFSRPDLRARQLLVHKLATLGLATRIDAFGNVFGRIDDESNAARPPVLVGSHLDTVPGGGRFDGTLGVVAGLEVAAIVREHIGKARFPLEIVSFSCEESSRFGRGTLGSGLLAGTWDPDEILQLTDHQGRRLRDVLRSVGLDPAQIGSAHREPGDFTAYLEVHIEQGRVLEESGIDVGIVDTIAAPTRMQLTLEGQADHSGATPMSLRRDALTGAAEVILAVERLSKSVPGVVGTVGMVRVQPGAINVVPGRAELSIDIRATISESKRRVVDLLHEEIQQICTARDLTPTIRLLSDEEPVDLDPRMMAILERCAAESSVSSLVMPSGAGHDAMHMARLCPTGMLLAPSVGGISHHFSEWTELDDIVVAIQVLVDAAVDIMLNGVPAK